jgi:hypothetical protein
VHVPGKEASGEPFVALPPPTLPLQQQVPAAAGVEACDGVHPHLHTQPYTHR